MFRQKILFLIPIIGIALSTAGYFYVKQSDVLRVMELCDIRANWRAASLAYRLQEQDAPVVAAGIMFDIAKSPVTAEQFDNFGSRINHAIFPLRALSWSPLIEQKDRARFEETIPGHRIYEQNADRALVRSDDRESYLPLVYEKVYDDQNLLIGFDLLADPVRRDAIFKARDEGVITAAPILSVTVEQVIYEFYFPVYEGRTIPPTVEERRAKFRGIIDGTFRAEATINVAIADTPVIPETIYFLVNAGIDGKLEPIAKAHDSQVMLMRPDEPIPAVGDHSRGITITRQLNVYGMEWTLIYNFNRDYIASISTDAEWYVAFLGLLVTGLLTIYLSREQQRKDVLLARVAERQESEASRTHFAALVASSTDAIMAKTNDGIITCWNSAAEGIFGYTASEMIGQSIERIIPDHLKDEELTIRSRICDDEAITDYETVRLRKGGGTVPISVTISPIKDQNGNIIGAFKIARDITDRIKLMQQLVQSQKMEAIGQLTGGMAHDFNNILNVVINNLDMVNEQLHAPITELDDAIEAALTGADLVHRLLSFARRQPLLPKVISLNTLLENLLPLLRRSIGEQIEIKTNFDPNLWLVMADPGQFDNATLNLAINARDAMLGGGVLTIETHNKTVDCEISNEDDEIPMGEYAVVSVTDTGCGIPPDVMKRVFDPFFTTKEIGQGSGLGLSMVLGYTKQSGGTVRIYSEVNTGTSVRMYLPRELDHSSTDTNIVEIKVLVVGGNEHILLVEDSAKARVVVERILISLGYHVVICADADEAMVVINSGKYFDLLFTDVVMPGSMNGLEAARLIRAARPSIKILITSGFSDLTGNDIADLEARFIVKPFRKVELAKMLRRLLDDDDIDIDDETAS